MTGQQGHKASSIAAIHDVGVRGHGPAGNMVSWSVSGLTWITGRWNNVQILSFKAWCQRFNDWDMGYVVSYACGIYMVPFLCDIYVLKNKLTIKAFLCSMTLLFKVWSPVQQHQRCLRRHAELWATYHIYGIKICIPAWCQMSCSYITFSGPALWSRCY